CLQACCACARLIPAICVFLVKSGERVRASPLFETTWAQAETPPLHRRARGACLRIRSGPHTGADGRLSAQTSAQARRPPRRWPRDRLPVHAACRRLAGGLAAFLGGTEDRAPDRPGSLLRDPVLAILLY